jgi:flagellar assembly protein FliH
MFSDFGGRIGSAGSRRHGVTDTSTYSPTKRLTDEDLDQEVESRVQARLAQLEQQIAASHAQGFEEGRVAAMSEVDQQQREIENRYRTVLQDISNQLNESIGAIEQQSLNLALQISEKLVGTVVEVNPEYILGIIKEALKLSGASAVKSIKVSPQDLEFLSLLELPKEFKEFDGSWRFEADDSIRAGCVVQMAGGEVDYRLDKAWERIKDQVVKVG